MGLSKRRAASLVDHGSTVRRVIALGALFSISCAPGTSADSEGAGQSAPEAITTEAPPIEAQPRMEALQRNTPVELGYEPGTTGWVPFQEEIPAPADSVDVTNPLDVVSALAHDLGWSLSAPEDGVDETKRIQIDGERATGVLLQWGFMDDAVAGQDIRVSLVLEDGGWRVMSVERRSHCRRGVSPQQSCR